MNNFENGLKNLETIVDEMEQGGLSLEDSLKKFEQGIALARKCQKALQAAEQKVRVLSAKDSDDKVSSAH